MAWQMRYNDTDHIIEIVYSDMVSHAEIIESAREGAVISGHTGCHLFLLKFDTVHTGPPAYQLIDQIDHFHTIGVSRKVRLAILLPAKKEIREGLMFYETACLNRGYLVKVFQKTEEAKQWLHPGSADSAKPPDSGSLKPNSAGDK